MRMADRKPRARRFEFDPREVKLAALRDSAPTLGGGKRLRWYALMGSALMLLSVAGFYIAMQIHRVASEQRQESFTVEVEPAPEILPTETEKALQRIEAEAAAAEAAYAEQLEALKAVDLGE
jgi:hypothetical protein